MIIKIDIREPDLLQQINHLTSTIPIFKKLIIKSEEAYNVYVCDS